MRGISTCCSISSIKSSFSSTKCCSGDRIQKRSKIGEERRRITTHLTRRHEEQVQLLKRGKRQRMNIRTESVTVQGRKEEVERKRDKKERERVKEISKKTETHISSFPFPLSLFLSRYSSPFTHRSSSLTLLFHFLDVRTRRKKERRFITSAATRMCTHEPVLLPEFNFIQMFNPFNHLKTTTTHLLYGHWC